MSSDWQQVEDELKRLMSENDRLQKLVDFLTIENSCLIKNRDSLTKLLHSAASRIRKESNKRQRWEALARSFNKRLKEMK
jgi:hypothetical protein